MSLIDTIYDRARALNKTIILPEASEERNLKAASEILKKRYAKIVLAGSEDEIRAGALNCGVDISGATIRDPSRDPDLERFISELVLLRKNKGMTEDKAAGLISDPLCFAAMMVKLGQADGYVSGANHSTGDVLRPALQIIKTAPGCKTVSSFFIMVLPDSSPYSKTQKELFFADCAVVPAPSAEQLADIAVSTAASYESLVKGGEPRIAMLSFSTKGSAEHPDAEKVIQATGILKEKAPGLLADGELQADAALVPGVGEKKCHGSVVAGKANILVFPDLDSGNIAYKLVQRLAGAMAIGPIVQGLDKPVNDLSRGCSVQDIVDTVAVTACQSEKKVRPPFL